MLTDYKFRLIKRDGMTTVQVAFFEGEMVDQTVPIVGTEKTQTVSVYVRSRIIASKQLTFGGNVSLEVIANTLNAELAKDVTRAPIDAQSTVRQPIVSTRTVEKPL